MVDLTRGKLSENLKSLSNTPTWNNFSMGRIRQATDINLPTSGHLLSHNIDEIRDELIEENLNNVLILDDTSFSGSTSLIIEDLLQQSFPGREINFTHGFLILNTGQLGPNPGASQRLTENGDIAIGGKEMKTPRDDGWHFFDLVKQENIEDHLLVVEEILSLLNEPNFNQLATRLLSNEENLELMFPHLVDRESLEESRLSGHFIGSKKLNGDFHVRNPQLLPNIIGQSHLSMPEEWRGNPEEAFDLLIKLNKLLTKGNK